MSGAEEVRDGLEELIMETIEDGRWDYYGTKVLYYDNGQLKGVSYLGKDYFVAVLAQEAE